MAKGKTNRAVELVPGDQIISRPATVAAQGVQTQKRTKGQLEAENEELREKVERLEREKAGLEVLMQLEREQAESRPFDTLRLAAESWFKQRKGKRGRPATKPKRRKLTGPDITPGDAFIYLRYEERAWQIARDRDDLDNERQPGPGARWDAWIAVTREVAAMAGHANQETVRSALLRARRNKFLGVKLPIMRGDPAAPGWRSLRRRVNSR